MNAFREHQKNSIRFGYRCFDRILLCRLTLKFFYRGAWHDFKNSQRTTYDFNARRRVHIFGRVRIGV